MSKKQTRLFLWVVPRSVSTAFFRAMTNRKNIKVLMEPYTHPYYFGPQRIGSRYDAKLVNEEETMDKVKVLCEQPYPDADEVFIKSLAFVLLNQPDYMNLLPTGYIHTFLIRHPSKTISSLYRVTTDKELSDLDTFDPEEVGFKELYQMLELVTTKLGQDAIIVDADDLIAYPESILRQYCNRVGIEFQQSMLEWNDDPRNDPMFKVWPAGWFENAFASKGFQSSPTKSPNPSVQKPLPADLQQVIEKSMPYYEKMHVLRIKPEI